MADDSELKDSDILEDPLEFEIPDNLDADLGDDWESAFQAEEFIFPEEIGGKVPLSENGTNDLDLSSLLEGNTTQQQSKTGPAEGKPGQQVVQPAGGEPPAAAFPLTFPASAAAFLLSLGSWYASRPRLQKILIPALPAALALIVLGVFFSRSTYNELEKQAAVIEQKQAAPPLKQEAAAPPPKAEEQKPLTAEERKIRKKWSLPAFFIPAGEKNNPSVFIAIDMTLIALLRPDEQLPEHYLTSVRDTVFQFYRNRSTDELKHFSLARGEMIRQLTDWLKKEWPDSPITSVMFNKYQVIN